LYTREETIAHGIYIRALVLCNNKIMIAAL
jgi:hypothetical protein